MGRSGPHGPRAARGARSRPQSSTRRPPRSRARAERGSRGRRSRHGSPRGHVRTRQESMVRPWTSPRPSSRRRSTGSSTRATAGSSSTPSESAGASRRAQARSTNFGGDILFDQIGVGIDVLGPGEPMSMYHWESDEEDFLLLSGTATLIVEGQERPLRRWDFVALPAVHRAHDRRRPRGLRRLRRRRARAPHRDRPRRRAQGQGRRERVHGRRDRDRARRRDRAGDAAGRGVLPVSPRRFVRYGGWLD